MKVCSKLVIVFVFFSIQLKAMGLRSFVALPVDKGGSVLRFLNDYNFNSNSDVLSTSLAYGLSGTQALLMGIPARLSNNTSSSGDNLMGDFSMLYRQTLWQDDTVSGSNRLAFLGGFVLPTNSDRKVAAQAGMVFTHFKNRHEIDVDFLYRKGFDSRIDSGRYDISWQYRINPKVLPDWGISDEIYSVLEFNGRWKQDNTINQQVTFGLSWIKPKWVIEGGLIKEVNFKKDMHLVLSTRIHF